MKTHLRAWLGVYLFVLALLIRFFLSLSNKLFESIYFNNLFRYIRYGQDGLSAILPVPGYYLIFVLLLGWLIWRRPSPIKSGRSWKIFGRRTANLLGTFGALFLLLWGYNYLDRGIAERMHLKEAPDRSQLGETYLQTMERAMAFRSQIPKIDLVATVEDITEIPNDQTIGNWVATTLQDLGYPENINIRVRHIRPDGALRRLSISGIYNPFTGEANVDNALGPLQKTFTIAHEIAHGHGITGEADANFVAYLACIQSGVPLAQYAAEYVLWRHLASEVRSHYPESIAAQLAAAIPEALRKDREAIWRNHYQYKGYFPEISDAINDTYLKVQGVDAGTDDYDRFVNLYFDWLANYQINK
jgi:hypothetical protein